MPRFSAILGQFKLFKYRQKNEFARKGARGGWRIYALFDGTTMYPIIVYPKNAWEDATYDVITEAVKELLKILPSNQG